jgi:cytochrome c biogenesis protein CcdA
MESTALAAVGALWLGVLTSISPCPLATNIVAISFIGKRVGQTRQVLLSGLLYTAGRVFAYLALAVVLIAGVLSIPQVSNFLQKYMNKLLGPILILAGMFLLELITVNLRGVSVSEKMKERAERGGMLSACLMGFVFALSFCPISAALFFGSLIPLSIKHGSKVLFPSLYGLGTAVPVVAFAMLVALGAQSLGKAFNKLTQVELWARRATGVVFICVGVYLSLRYIFGII